MEYGNSGKVYRIKGYSDVVSYCSVSIFLFFWLIFEIVYEGIDEDVYF